MELYQKLEKEYADFAGSEYATSCSSGTSALHLALKALDIRQCDEVIVPEFTMIACAFAVSYCGATPVFVDCNDSLNIDVAKIEEKITERTRAIMPVHIYGRLANMEKILEIAKRHNLYVVEDACEAQGAVYESKADITCYSFYQNKIIHAEEGGVATTNNEYLKGKMDFYKNMAFSEKHDYTHNAIGFNYRMTNGGAGMALESLRAYPKEKQRREELVSVLEKSIGKSMGKRDANWVYDIDCGDNQEEIMESLKVEGYRVRHFFKPMSMQRPYRGEYEDLNAYKWSKRGAYIQL